MASASEKPLLRSRHVAVKVGEVTYVWGGLDNRYKPIPASVLEVFDGHWSRRATTGEAPAATTFSTAAAIGDRLYHYGGRNGERRCSNSLHSIQVGEWVWREVEYENPGGAPPATYGHAMIAHGDDLIVTCGEIAPVQFTNGLRVFNTKTRTWRRPKVSGTEPPPCAGCTFDLYGKHHAILYGGTIGHEKNGNIYILHIAHWHWTRVDSSHGGPTGPEGRWCHASCVITGSPTGTAHPLLLVVGGLPPGRGDSWVLDLETKIWTKVNLPRGVCVRWAHTIIIAWAGDGQVMVMVHGGLRDGDVVADTTVIHLDVLTSPTNHPSPILRVLEVTASEWDPEIPNTQKKPGVAADQRRWRRTADNLHNLVKVQQFLNTKETIAVKSATIVLIGTPRAGKTTILKRLTEDPSYIVSPLEELPSTGLADKPIRVLIKKPTATPAKCEGSRVVPQDFKDTTRYLAKHTLHAVSKYHPIDPVTLVKKEATDQPQFMTPKETDHPLSSGNKPSGRFDIQDQPQTQTSVNASSESSNISDHTNPGLSFLTPNDIMGATTRNLTPEDIRNLEGCTFINIIDTGGHPELFEALPPFVSGSTICVVIVRLIDKLGQRYKVVHVSADGRRVEYVSTYTLEEVILQVLSTFSSKASVTLPPRSPQSPTQVTQSAAILVGTHKDLVTDSAVNSLDVAVQEKLRGASHSNTEIIHYQDPGTMGEIPSFRAVVPVDNTSQSDPGLSLLQDLISQALDREIRPVDIPHSWIMLEHSLRSTGRKILTFRECAFIGRRCGLESDEEVKTALWFLTHQFGTIRYYPNVEGLEGIVFVDVQVLFNSATSLIMTRYKPRGMCIKVDCDFYRTGRCPRDAAEKLIQCTGEIPPVQLLCVLEHLQLLTPVKDKKGKSIEYFVPTVLKSFPVETLMRSSSAAGKPAPLLFSFSCGFCPLGLFHLMVVHLSSPELHSPLEWELFTDEIFRNKVMFYVGEDRVEVTLIARPSFFEVWVDQQEGEEDEDRVVPLAEVCAVVRSTIDNTITTVKSSVDSILTVSHQIGFYCQRAECSTSHSDHPAVLKKITSRKSKCVMTGRYSAVKPEQRMWLKEDKLSSPGRELHQERQTSTMLPGHLTIEDFKVIQTALWDIRYKWFQLGVELDFSVHDLESIRYQFRNESEMYLPTLILHWLQRLEPQATWSALVTALKQPTVGQEGVALEIERKVLSN